MGVGRHWGLSQSLDFYMTSDQLSSIDSMSSNGTGGGHPTFLYIFSTLDTFFNLCLVLQSCLTDKSLVQSSSEVIISKRVVSTHVQEL